MIAQQGPKTTLETYLSQNPMARYIHPSPLFMGLGRADLAFSRSSSTRDEDGGTDSAAMAVAADLAAGLVVYGLLGTSARWSVKAIALGHIEAASADEMAATLVVRASGQDADWSTTGDKVILISIESQGPGTLRATGHVIVTVA